MSKLHRIILMATFGVFPVILLGKFANADHATLRVVNASSSTIVRFYASPYWYSTYTGDLLGSYVVRPGEYWYVDLSDGQTTNCIYDLKVILANGQIFEDRENVCGNTLTIYDQ